MTSDILPMFGRLNAGEVTPRVEGRIDLDFLPASWRRQINMISLPQGPVTRRPGTRFVAELKSSATAATLVPFTFSTAQAYQIELGAGYLRFYRDKARIPVATTDAVVSNGDFTAGITGWTDRSEGAGSIAHDAGAGRLSLVPGGATSADIGWAEQVVAVGGAYQAGEHVLRFRICGMRGDQVELRIGTSSKGAELVADRVCATGWHLVAFTPGAANVYIQFRNRATTNHAVTAHNKTLQVDDVLLLSGQPLELVTPYQQADLFYPADDKFNPGRRRHKTTQSYDWLYLWHAKYLEYQLARYGDTSWSLVEMLQVDGPYLDENTTPTTLTPGAATGAGVTLTASSTVGINGGAGFKPSDVGRLVRYKNGSNAWGWCIITAWASSTQVSIDILGTFTAAAASTVWRLGLWSATHGFPAAGVFHDERLWRVGGTTTRPSRCDGSKTGDFDVFTPGVNPGDPIAFSIGADDVATALWVASQRDLIVGTPSRPFAVRADTSGALTPTNAKADAGPKFGCADMRPVAVGGVLLYLEQHGRRLRELVYALENESYRAPDLSIRADHLFASRRLQLLDAVYQHTPFSVLWGFRADGQLVSFSYERDQEVLAWARQPIGGTDAAVEAVSVTPGVDGDELWLIVRRTIGGVTRRYVEVMESPLELEDAQADAWHVDSGLQYAGAPTASLTGLGHLEGEVVSIWTDKGVHPPRQVVLGTVALDFDVSQAQVGLSAPWRLHSQRLDIVVQNSSIAGRKRRVSKVRARFLRSIGVSVGRDDENSDLIPFRNAGDPMGQAPTLFSGDKESVFSGDWDTDGGVQFFGNGPGPVTLTAVIIEAAVAT